MPELEPASQRLSDLDLLAQAQRDVNWIASLIGKEPWATEEMLDDLKNKVIELERKLRESEPEDLYDSV